MKLKLKSEEVKVILAFICVCIFWGSAYVAIRIGVKEFPPALFAGLRFLTAGILMLLYAKVMNFEFPHNYMDIARISVVGLFLLLGGNGLVVWAEKWVNSGVASLIIATVPFFIALIELLMPGRKNLNILGWIGLLIGFSGVAFLIFDKSYVGSINFIGILLLLMASLMWSIGSVYSKTFNATGSIVSQIGIEMLAGGAALTLAGIFGGEVEKAHFTFSTIAVMAYLIVFGSIVAYSCYIYILKKWPATKAGTYTYINPLVASLLGALVLNELVTLKFLLSTAIILGGVFLVQLSKKPFAKNMSVDV